MANEIGAQKSIGLGEGFREVGGESPEKRRKVDAPSLSPVLTAARSAFASGPSFSLSKKMLLVNPPPTTIKETSSSSSIVFEDPYKKAAAALGNTQWDEFGNLFKEITVGGKTYRGECVGKGDSFQCYKCYEVSDELKTPVVIKVFNTSDPAVSRQRKRKAPQELVADFDQRMNTLRHNYQAAGELGISRAKIFNTETFETDGCILQEFTEPVRVTWGDKETLTDDEAVLIQSFSDVLAKAMLRPDLKTWDLPPKNFGVSSSKLELFDLGDVPFSTSQWVQFEFAVLRWVGNNPEAKRIVREKLDELAQSDAYSQNKDNIEKILTLVK